MLRQIIARSQSSSSSWMYQNKFVKSGSGVLALTMLLVAMREDDHLVKNDDDDETKKKDEMNNNNNNWVNDIQKDASQWFQNHVIWTQTKQEQQQEQETREEDGWNKMKENMTSWLVRGELSPDDMKSIVDNATTSKQSDATLGRQSFMEIQSMLIRNFQDISNVLTKHFGSLFQMEEYLDPTSMYYYLEEQDAKKNPSWKRRLHRYHPYVQVDDLQQYYSSLQLAELSYNDTVDTIQQTLQNQGYELLFCELQQDLVVPENKASHFVALPKQQSFWSDTLEVFVVVRGTKSVSDMMTDALMEAIPYRGGVAHAGIVKSGCQLAQQHTSLFEKLRTSSNKKKVHITFIGHSLGAGVATIAAMELQNNQDNHITAHVTGFGCPALLSKELSEEVKPYVTTIIADSDVIPRMSAATIANLVMDIMEYDWKEYGERDIQQALEELLHLKPPYVERTMKFISQGLHKYASIKPTTTERITPQLFPPGQCIHFYRDGFSISGTYSPCTFFQSIDVSRTMIHDHLISVGYRRIFLDIMRDHSGDAHFSFEQPPKTTK